MVAVVKGRAASGQKDQKEKKPVKKTAGSKAN
jgi:hypothetical protein